MKLRKRVGDLLSRNHETWQDVLYCNATSSDFEFDGVPMGFIMYTKERVYFYCFDYTEDQSDVDWLFRNPPKG